MEELTLRIRRELLEGQQELIIQKGQELYRLLLGDLLYIEAEGNYLVLQLKNEKIRIRETMTNMENKLCGKGFIRCHKGYLVNTWHIEKLKGTEVMIRQGEESIAIPVGRSYEKDVRKMIYEMIRDEN